MPYISVETSKTLQEAEVKSLLTRFSSFLAELLGKPERVFMVSIKAGVPMLFAGTKDSCAYIILKSIGLAEEKCPDLTKAICEFIEPELDVSPERIYIDFANINGKMFGWNKKTF